MVAWAGARAVALGMVVGSLLVGCMGEGSSGFSGSADFGEGSGSSSGGPSGGSSSSSGGAVAPMLVVVDPNRTMSASPGEGVGVFTQYVTGGHWNVWWTCDTSKTSLPCAFAVNVSVTTGTIANVVGQGLEPAALAAETSQQIEVATTTTTTVQGVTFDTVVPEGTIPVITLNATLGGQADGSYFFFVQDGSINGDYQGTLTDPLMFEPQSP